MDRRFVVAVTMGWMLACGAGDVVEEAGNDPVAIDPVDKAVDPEPAPEPTTAQGKLLGLEQGDVACYVQMKTKEGELSLHGDFELCPGGGSDATAFVGKRVRYQTIPTNVQAGSCEGNPDCTDTEEVPLVIEVMAAK